MQSKASRNQLNLPHGTETKTGNAKSGEQPESVVSVGDACVDQTETALVYDAVQLFVSSLDSLSDVRTTSL